MEYAIVFAAFVCVVAGIGALWRLVDGGALLEHALSSAPHHLSGVCAGAIGDVLSY